MSLADERVDAKRGFSTMCRRGDHAACKTAKARCCCDCHGSRGQEPPSPKEPAMRPERAMRAVPESSDGPAIEVVRVDPPNRGRGSSIAGRLAEALAEVKETPGVWFRVATFPTKTGANAAQTSCKKAYDGFTFAARRVGDSGSGLWACFGEPT